jgi:dTDP-4-amino-4,6-dideoxygalactose transaminase
VTLPDRDGVARALAAEGVGTAVYYPVPLSRQPALAGISPPARTPRADRFCASCLALPVHEELGDDEVERVILAMWRAAA